MKPLLITSILYLRDAFEFFLILGREKCRENPVCTAAAVFQGRQGRTGLPNILPEYKQNNSSIHSEHFELYENVEAHKTGEIFRISTLVTESATATDHIKKLW